MTTKPTTTHAFLPLPDPPEREPDDMTSVQHLGENGNLHHLIQYLGNPETTIVSGERYIVPVPGTPSNQRIAPDMLISFNGGPGAIPAGQQLRHIQAGQASGPGNGDSLGENRQERC